MLNKVIIFHCREIIQCSVHLSNKTEFSIKCCDRKKLGQSKFIQGLQVFWSWPGKPGKSLNFVISFPGLKSRGIEVKRIKIQKDQKSK